MQRIDILIWSNSKREYIPLGLASPDAPVELPDKLELAYEQRPNQLPNGIPVRFGPAQGQEDRHRVRQCETNHARRMKAALSSLRSAR
jgi:hypothetical protein